MKVLNKLFNQYESFIKFGIVGVINTTISLIIYYVLLLFGLHYLIANAIGYMIGIINGYILSSRYVFKSNINVKKVSKFVLIYLSSFMIGSLILIILVEHINIHKKIAPIIVTLFNLGYNYIINKKWTFNK